MLFSDFLTSVKRLMFIRLIFGHYYYVGNSKIIKFLIRIYCFIFTTFSCVFIFIFTDVTFVILIKFYYVEFIFNCMISFLFQSKYVNGIFSLVSITANTLNDKYITVSYKTIGSFLILLVIRITLYVYITRDLGYILVIFLNCILLFSMFINYISKILFFDILYRCMKTVRKAFEYKYVRVNFIGKERVKHRIKNIKTCLSVYDYLLQRVENMDLGLEIWLFFTVLVYFPKAVLIMRDAMMHILNKELLTFETIWTVFMLLIAIGVGTWPMVLFELTKNEVDIIKDVLFKQSLMDIDETLRLETQLALRHVDLRPCEYRVCRTMPMGVGLSLSFICLCITYVIVLVQLTPDK